MAEPVVDRAAAVSCRTCNGEFGFAVVHCPFCSTRQRVSSPQAALPSAALPAATAFIAPAPAAASLDIPLPLPASSVADKAAVPAPEPTKTPAPAGGKRRALPWLRILVGVGVCIAGAWLLRPDPGATLRVDLTSGANGRVLVDGSDAGRTGEILKVAAGPHEVGFEADGTAGTLRIVLAAGESRVVNFPVPLPASKAVATLVFQRDTPDISLRIDNRAIDPGDDAVVAPGPHLLTASSPGHAELSLHLILEPGERRVVPLTLSPAAPLPALQPALAAPQPDVAPPPATPLPVVQSGDWSTFGDATAPVRSCGVQAGISGGTLMLFGRSDAPATLRLALHKEAWHIPGLAVPMDIAFPGGPSFHFQASGDGQDIRADIPDEEVRSFIHHFSADDSATLTLPEGHEAPWPIDLHGTTPTITGMAKCLEAAELWLPPPFTQRPAGDAPAPAPGQN